MPTASTHWRQISRPFLSPGGFVTPKLQLHTTHYQFDSALSNGSRSASRTLPYVQRGQRAGVRARREFLRPLVPANAGAPGLLHLHALQRPEPPAGV